MQPHCFPDRANNCFGVCASAFGASPVSKIFQRLQGSWIPGKLRNADICPGHPVRDKAENRSYMSQILFWCVLSKWDSSFILMKVKTWTLRLSHIDVPFSFWCLSSSCSSSCSSYSCYAGWVNFPSGSPALSPWSENSTAWYWTCPAKFTRCFSYSSLQSVPSDLFKGILGNIFKLCFSQTIPVSHSAESSCGSCMSFFLLSFNCKDQKTGV